MGLVKIGKAAETLGVSVQTLHKWEATGELVPDRKSAGGTRYYDLAKILKLGNEDAPTVAYARVSSHDQKADLARQAELLEAFCAAKGWRFEIIQDLGSGLNYRKKGLNTLLEMILRRKMRRLVLTHKDRLLRFGSELVFALCELQNIEIVIINKGEQPSFEEELAKDVIEIITVFSARLYGSRSNKNKKMLEALSAGGQVVVRKSMHQEDVEDPLIANMLEEMRKLQDTAKNLIIDKKD
jgi:predicted site-specific integrase-resolvase